MKKPPGLFVASFVAYILYEAWTAVVDADDRAPAIVRLLLTVTIFFFAVRGSRIATNIWATLSLLGGLLGIYLVFLWLSRSPPFSFVAFAAATLMLANAAYFFFSPAVRQYQQHCRSSNS